MRVLLLIGLLGDAPADQAAKIQAEFQAAAQALDAERRNPKAKAAKLAALTARAKPDGYAERMLNAVRKAPESPESFDALAWILTKEGGPGLAAAQEEAAYLTLRHHLEAAKLPQLCTDLSASRSAAAERLLRGVLEKSPARDARGKACVALAACLQSAACWADYCQFADAQQRRMMDLTPEGKALQKRMAEVDARAARDEAKLLTRRANKEFADLRPPPTSNNGSAAAVGGPAVGKPAPDIVGEDLDGRPMKLSDYRGKVVVIEFWAWWCVYCRALVPPDQELLSRMRGRPFALLGVNSDGDIAAAEKAAHDAKQVWPTWPSWRNGRAIAAQWGVIRWPTTCVLDHRGVVRHVGLTGKDLEDAVEALVKDVPVAK